MKMVPGAPNLNDEQVEQASYALKRTEVIINSMTRDERRKPEMIKSSRKIRIANGSGTTPKEVTKVIESYLTMSKQLKQMRSNPMMLRRMMRK